MSITVNTNMSSIIAQRSLYKATNKMNTALERLSTGLRINSAKDDAAGSAISTKLEYKMSSYDVAKDNAQMGQSMLETANGTLSNINSMLQRMRDLSEQAANGTYGTDERKAMQAEIDGLTEEIYRIKNTTEFNGKKIFGEEVQETKTLTSIPTMSIADTKTLTSVPTMSMADVSEANWDDTENEIIGISSAKELKKMADLINSGKSSENRTFALTADINLDDLGDIDGNGSNWEPIGYRVEGGIKTSFEGIFDGNNFTISNLKIKKYDKTKYYMDGVGFIGRSNDYTELKNINLTNVCIDIAGVSDFIAGLLGKMTDGIISNCSVSGTIKGLCGTGGSLLGFQDGGTIINCNTTGEVSVSGTEETSVGGFIGYYSGGNISNCKTTAKVTGNNIDGATGAFAGVTGAFAGVNFNEGTGTISDCEYNSTINGSMPATGYGDNTGITDNPNLVIDDNTDDNTDDKKVTNNASFVTNLQVGINSDASSVITIDTGFTLGDFSVSVLEEKDARASIDTIDAMMNKITAKMTEIGATQNRLESTMEFQEVQRNALTSANSLIKDADIAEESANYVKNQILQNVTATLLATANQNPSVALQLI